MMQDINQIILAGYAEQARQNSLTDLQILEEFVIDNPDLERLESLVDQFNIFDAIGMAHQEIRHSFFLKFLLDPNENHGLSDVFLKKLLQKVLAEARDASLPISLIDLDVWDLDATTVQREWNSIDILILNATHKMAVIIENKVYSDEHSDQLTRYWKIVEQNYPDWRILGLFLTPDGSLPSDERYLPVSYVVVADLIDALIVTRANILGTEVRILLTHYTQMLRRHIVSGSEIDELCLRLYQRHQRALDLIFERRPDRQKTIQAEVEKMIKNTPGFELDKSTKTNIRFVPTSWEVPSLLKATSYGGHGRILVFYFDNRSGGVRIILEINPGDAQTRQKLFDMACSHKSLFSPGKSLSPMWSSVYKLEVLNKKALEEASITDIENQLRRSWDSFRNEILPKIEQVMQIEGIL